jgi:TatA/E family protein of Tat protein translocase
MPFGIQPLHLVIIAVVALLIFGPSRLPEIGRGVGKALKEFQRGTKEMGESFKEEVTKPVADDGTAPAPAAQPPVAYTQTVPQPLPQPVPQNVPQQPVQQPVAQTSWQAVTPSEPEPQAAAATNFCTQCGSSNPVGARFCNKCGSPIQG